MNRVSLNPSYGIRNDKYCSFIYVLDDSFDLLLKKLPSVYEIPSLYGYILSYFREGDDPEKIICKIAEDSGVRKEAVSKFVAKAVNCKTALEIKYEDQILALPPWLLVDETVSTNGKAKIFTHKEFDPFQKFVRTRPSAPFTVTLMLTSRCHTDCIYCYADRTRKVDFELANVLALIDDCHQSGVLKLTLSGGDLFAYRDWKAVLEKMYASDYVSFISTKIPLPEGDIAYLKEKGIREMQFSLDAADAENVNRIVKREAGYIEEVKEMLNACRKAGMKVNVRTVLTKYNATKETLASLYNLLAAHGVYSWNIVPAFFSSYREGYDDYQMDDSAMRTCKACIDKLATGSDLKISFRKLQKGEGIDAPYKTVDDFLRYNKACLTTSHNLSINVSGEVTACEMLYNREKFHLGNANRHTIQELWNSELVKDFYDFKFASIPRNPESPCYACKEYARCKVGNMKKVCLVDIVNVFGEDKWDYPDPRCPYAPPCDMNLLIK